MKDIEELLRLRKPQIDGAIERWIPRRYDERSLAMTLGFPRYRYNLEAPNRALADVIWEFLDRGGKRWRPVLLLLTYEALGGKKDVLDFAVIPEVIHNGCVVGDTLILDSEGVSRKIADFKEGQEVLSLDFDGSIVKQRVVKTHQNGFTNVFKVKTRNREITATENHPFLVISKSQPYRLRITKSGRALLEKKLSQSGSNISRFCNEVHPTLTEKISLKHMKNALYGYATCSLPIPIIEDIASKLGLDIEKYWEKIRCKYEKAEINLEWKKLKDLEKGELIVITKEVVPSDGIVPKIPIVTQNCKDRNKIPEKFTIEFAQLLGFVLGDGCVSWDRVSLCTPMGSPEREYYTDLTEKIFKAKPSISKNVVTICSKAVAKIVADFGFKKHALDKEIPDWIFKLPRTHKLAFVRGYLDSDGSVAKNGIVTFECANKKIITKLKVLLDTLGFTTGNICTRKVDNRHFKRYVKKKETRLYHINLSSKNKVLREIGSEIEEYRNRLGKKASRRVSFRFEEDVPSFPKNMSQEEIGFNRIVCVDYVGKRHTYDLQIEGTHNYISNGIVTHNTLLIDDLEDSSELRRGKPCTYKIFGTDVAINAGSAMYFLPFIILRDSSLNSYKKSRMFEIMTQEMLNCHFGQATDIFWHNGKADNIAEEEYLQMCAYKTGTLARMAAKLGALLAGAKEDKLEIMGKYAESIGIAFQIQDDILNLSGDKFIKGKGFGEDIHEGKRSLIVIHALQNASEEERKRLLEILNRGGNNGTIDGEVIEAIELLKKYGSMFYAKKKAETLVKDSWKDVDRILPDSEAKENLKLFADYLIEREI